MAVDVSTLTVRVVGDGIKETSQALSGLGTSAANVEKRITTLTGSIDKLLNVQKTATGAAQAYMNAMQGATSSVAGSAGTTNSLASATTALAKSMALLSASMFAVESRAKTSSSAIAYHTNSMNDAHAAARGLTGSLGALWLTYGSVIPLAAGAAIGASFKQIVSIGREVENTLEGIRILGESTTKEVAAMRDVIISLGQGINGPQDVAKALSTLVLAGLSATDAVKGVGAALDLAAVGGVSVEKAASTLVQVSTALGYTADGFSRVSDVIAKAAAVSMSSVESISGAFKSAAAVGELYGASLVDIGVGLAALSNLGIQGTAAGTALKNFYKDLSTDSDKVKGTLKDMHMTLSSFKDSDGFFLPLIDVVKKLDAGLSTLTGPSRQDALAKMFGERGVKEGTALIKLLHTVSTEVDEFGKTYANKLEEYNDRVNKSYAFAALGAIAMAQTSDGQLKAVANTLQTVFLKAFQDVSPQIGEVSRSLKSAFNSPEFLSSIKTIATAFADLTMLIVDHIGTITKLAAFYVTFKAVEFASGIVKIALAFDVASVAAKGFAISLGPIGIAIAALTTLWTLYKAAKNDATNDNSALNSLEEQIGAMRKKDEELQQKLAAKKSGISELAYAQQEQMKKDKEAIAAGLEGASKSVEAMQKEVGMKMSLLSLNEKLQLGMKSANPRANVSSSVEAALAAQNRLNAAIERRNKLNSDYDTINKSLMANAKEYSKIQDAEAKAGQIKPTGIGELSGKVNKAAANDQYNAALKEIQGRIDQEKRALKSLEAQYDSEYKQGIIGEIALISMKEAAQIKAAKTELGLLEQKLRVPGVNKEAVRQDIESHKQKMADQEVESAHRATQQIEEYYSKLQDNILKAEAQGYKDRGQHVNAFLSEFGAKHKLESKHIADNIVQEQAKVTAALAAISSGNAGVDVMSQLANSTARLDILFKQTTTSAEAFAAGIQTNAVKEAAESFDKLYLSLSNTLNGVKTSTEEMGMGTMLEAAQKASDKYTASLKDLAAAQQAIALAGAGGSPVDTAKAEEALAKMGTLAEVQRKLWVGVGESISKSLKEAFGAGGQAAGEMLQSVIAADNMQQTIAANRATQIAKLNADEYGYAEKIQKINVDAAKASSAASIKAYGNMASAAKGFFKQGTTGYKLLETAEKAFRVFEFAMQAKAIAMKLMGTEAVTSTVLAGKAIELSAMEAGSAAEAIHTAMSVEEAGAQSSAWGITAVVKAIASMPFPMNLVAGAATLAAVVAIGAKMSGGGGGSSVNVAEERQKAQGTGTVLGDEGAKSESLSKSLEILKDNSNIALNYSSKMLNALQSINDGISGMAASITQSSGLRGTAADQRGLGVGSSKSFLGFSSESKELVDSGIVFDKVQIKADEAAYKDALAKYTQERAAYDKEMEANFMGDAYHAGSYTGGPQAPSMMQTSSQTVGSVMSGGVSAKGYADTHSESSSFWGLFSDSSDDTQLKELGSDLKLQFAKTVESMYDGVLSAAGALGKDSKLWEGVLKNVSFEQAGLDKISLKGLSGADIEKELQAAFSKLGDTMAAAVMPQLAVFQKVGEGMFQTLIRVAAGVDTATFELEKMGIKAIDYTKILNKHGDVATEIVRDSIMAVEGMSKVGAMMVDLSGNMGDLISAYTDLKTIRDQLFAGGLNGNNVSRDMVRGAGGLDALKTGSQAFFDNFLSEAQQQASKVNALKVEFAAMNLTLPTTKQGYVALVKQMDNGTASGDKLVGKLLSLSGAFSEVAESAKEVALSSVDAAFDRLKRSVDAQKEALNKIYDEQLKALQEQRDSASTSLKNIQSVFDMLNSALKTAQPLARGAAQEILRAALAFSNAGGSLVNYAGLDDALQAVAKPSEQMFSTLVDYKRDQQITANTIAALRGNAKSQVSVAQMTLDAINASITTLDKNHLEDIAKLDAIITSAQSQVDAIHGVDNSVMSVEAAVQALAAALTSAKSVVAPADNANAVSGLYQSILGRNPDAEGGAYWAGQVNSGSQTLSQVSDALTAGKPINDAVMSSYKNMAGKTGSQIDEEGLKYWTSRAYEVGVAQMQQEFKGAVDGSHADGLDFVPKDNYRANLHKGERVLTAKQTKDADSVAAEIRQLREEMQAQALALIQASAETAKILRKFDNDGLPLFRDLDGTGVVIDVNVVSTV